MRAMGLALLITLVAFAGCLDGGDGDDSTPTDTATGSATPTETQSSTGSQTQTDTGTSDPEPEENTPPTASLSASIQQGEAPVNVTFTLDGADADGDELTWTFDADGDGTFEAEGTSADLPATYEHSYQDPGNHTATLTVSDGKDSATQTVTIDATAAAAEEGPVQTISLSWLVGVSDLVAPSEIYLCEPGPNDGVTHASFEIDAEATGLGFVATISDASDGEAIVGWGLFLSDPGCGETDYQFITVEGAGPIQDTVPAGYTFGVAFSEGGAMLDVTIEIG